MDVILIAAITLDGFMARKSNEIITWSKDLKLFKEQTMGFPVIMGSNTQETLAVDLKGREKVVVHRGDSPEKILCKLKNEKCFVIGGGMTNSKFAKYLTHLFITPHPLIFGEGIKLFTDLKIDSELEFLRKVTVDIDQGIYQYQYLVK